MEPTNILGKRIQESTITRTQGSKGQEDKGKWAREEEEEKGERAKCEEWEMEVSKKKTQLEPLMLHRFRVLRGSNDRKMQNNARTMHDC